MLRCVDVAGGRCTKHYERIQRTPVFRMLLHGTSHLYKQHGLLHQGGVLRPEAFRGFPAEASQRGGTEGKGRGVKGTSSGPRTGETFYLDLNLQANDITHTWPVPTLARHPKAPPRISISLSPLAQRIVS